MSRVLVCGGRDYKDRLRVFVILDTLLAQTDFGLLIEGAATGADSLAGEWAEARGVALQEFPADWARWGKSAGAIRNHQMLVEGRPDLVVAFPGGRGTANMVEQASWAGVPVEHVDR